MTRCSSILVRDQRPCRFTVAVGLRHLRPRKKCPGHRPSASAKIKDPSCSAMVARSHVLSIARQLLRQLEGLLRYVDLDEIEIADVDQKPEPLAHNEDRVAPVERVDEEQQAAADR